MSSHNPANLDEIDRLRAVASEAEHEVVRLRAENAELRAILLDIEEMTAPVGETALVHRMARAAHYQEKTK